MVGCRRGTYPAGVRHPFLVALALLPATASAHNLGVSLLELDARGTEVEASLAFHAAELPAAAALDRDGDGQLSPRELDAGAGAVAATSIERISIRSPAGACSRGPSAAGIDPQGGVRLEARFTCPGSAESGIDVELGFLAGLQPGHRVVGEARIGGATQAIAASASEPRLALRGESGGFLRFFLLGMEHIFTGFDHLLFLAGLLLVARSVGEVARLVTSFTVAHSLTLALAVTGVVELPGSIVEPAIAFSIVVVAVENLVRRDHRWRAWLTFGFGLIHGFGFAGLLRELGLGTGSLPITLGGFNLGVEAGQLAVVLAVAPLLLLSRKRPWYGRVAVPGFSAAIAFFGAYWLVERVLG